MKIAVKFYSQVSNPENLPGEWPAIVQELADDAEGPDDFTIMSVIQYKNYLTEKQSLYDDWFNTYKKPKLDAEKASEERREGIDRRRMHGEQIVKEFREFAIRLSEQGLLDTPTSIDMGSLLQSAKFYIDIGYLTGAIYVIQTASHAFLDNHYIDIYGTDTGVSVRNYFIGRLNEGNS